MTTRTIAGLALASAGLLAALTLALLLQPTGPAPASGGARFSIRLPDRVHYLQGDQRWSDDRLGGVGGSLAGEGCTVASVAMAMTNLGRPIDPKALNAALIANDGFVGRGWLVWDAIERLTNGALRADVHWTPSRVGMDSCLKRGEYPVVRFLLGGAVQHWVVVVGKQGYQYLARDPLVDEADPIPLSRRASEVTDVRCIGRRRAWF